MAGTTGLTAVANYAGAANDQARVQLLLDLVPNVDASNAGGSGIGQGAGASYLDEMSPGAAAALRVELLALKAAVS